MLQVSKPPSTLNLNTEHPNPLAGPAAFVKHIGDTATLFLYPVPRQGARLRKAHAHCALATPAGRDSEIWMSMLRDLCANCSHKNPQRDFLVEMCRTSSILKMRMCLACRKVS